MRDSFSTYHECDSNCEIGCNEDGEWYDRMVKQLKERLAYAEKEYRQSVGFFSVPSGTEIRFIRELLGRKILEEIE